jgi:hypothetical protein
MDIHLLHALSFVKQEPEDEDFYYYDLNLPGGLSLITNCNDEAELEGWRVFIFQTDPSLEFKEDLDLIQFISLIKRLTLTPWEHQKDTTEI